MKTHITSIILPAVILLGFISTSPGTTSNVFFSQTVGGAVNGYDPSSLGGVTSILTKASDYGNQGGASIVDTRNSFFQAVQALGYDTGTESFEGDPYTMGVNGMPPMWPHVLPGAAALNAPLDFGGVGTGTLSTTGNVLHVGDYSVPATPRFADPAGRFPFYPESAGEQQYVGNIATGVTTTIAFDQEVFAFGFFASDIADKGGILGLTLNYVGGGSNLIDLTTIGTGYQALDPADALNGTSMYFGVIADMAIQSVVVSYSGPSGDDFGLDVLSIGVKAVPETGHTLLLGSSMIGFLAFGASARRRRKHD